MTDIYRACQKDLPCVRRRLLVNLLRRWEEIFPDVKAKNRVVMTQLKQVYIDTGEALRHEETDEVF